MKRSKYILITIPLLIILLLVGMIYYRRYKSQPRFWYCSPTEPRGDDIEAWQKARIIAGKINGFTKNDFEYIDFKAFECLVKEIDEISKMEV